MQCTKNKLYIYGFAILAAGAACRQKLLGEELSFIAVAISELAAL